jgi:LacI family transcriptional regulator
MRDVAATAGVSLATVSRVINDKDTVDPELAALVREAIALLGYRRDATAMSLRRADRLSASVGLVFEDVANPFFAAVHRGFEEVARTRGVLTFAGSSDDEPERERQLAESFVARGADALLIVPAAGDQSYLRRDREAGLPLVFVDRPPRFIDADVVLTDNRAGTRHAAEHLLGFGHRRIGYLGDRRRIFTAAERLRGHREAFASEPDPALERLELSTSEAAYHATRELLLGPDPPTALVSSQNLITFGALRALRDLSLQQTVALVAFDDVPLSDIVQPGLTVIEQDPLALGRHAARLLFARLDGEQGASRQVVVPTRLVTRGSGELRSGVS